MQGRLLGTARFADTSEEENYFQIILQLHLLRHLLLEEEEDGRYNGIHSSNGD
jgi:hypothetical protein